MWTDEWYVQCPNRVGGNPCERCPSQFAGKDEFSRLTKRLIISKQIRAVHRCPKAAIGDALQNFAQDTVAEERSRKVWESSVYAEILHGTAKAKKALDAAYSRAQRACDKSPHYRLNLREDFKVGGWYKLSEAELLLKAAIAELKAEKPVIAAGRIGQTRAQSLVRGMLEAWLEMNGRYPSAGNEGFQRHLAAALTLVRWKPEIDLSKAIRTARKSVVKRD